MHAYMTDWQERERRLRKQAATVRGERRDNWNPNLGDAVTMQEKVDAGLKLLSQLLQETRTLELRENRPLRDRFAQYLVIGAGDKQTDIVLTHEFLSDLPNTPDCRSSAKTYIRVLAKRMANPHPMDFYCKTGFPIRVEIEWPWEGIQQRAASFVQEKKYDLFEQCPTDLVNRSHVAWLRYAFPRRRFKLWPSMARLQVLPQEWPGCTTTFSLRVG